MREAMNNNPTSRIVNGIALHGAAFASLDEGLAVADEDFVRAILGDPLPATTRMRPDGAEQLSSAGGREAARRPAGRGRGTVPQALAWCERERCPIEAGRCLQGLAEIAHRRGDTAEAMKLLDRAGELFRQHGAKFYLDQVITKKLEIQGVSSLDTRTSIDAVASYRAAANARPALARRAGRHRHAALHRHRRLHAAQRAPRRRALDGAAARAQRARAAADRRARGLRSEDRGRRLHGRVRLGAPRAPVRDRNPAIVRRIATRLRRRLSTSARASTPAR